MSSLALALALASAVAHASWNLMSKQAAHADDVVFVWLVVTASTVLWAPVAAGYLLLGGTFPTPAGLAAIAGSTAVHVVYFMLLQRGYRHGDLSMVYPIARGTGPLLASLVAVVLLGERPGPAGVAGILLVGTGVFLLGATRRPTRRDLTGIGFGFAVGVCIAAYTVWDKQAVSAFGVAPLMLNYLGELGRSVVMTPAVLTTRRRGLITPTWREHRVRVLGAAVLGPFSYLLMLIAFTFSPISSVAPVREISVLIAVVLGGRLLAEGDLPRRLLAAGVIVAGVVTIALN
ncbi:drug/metabolite transporter (DMT)-like permease [Streptosporangium becharense]|uniref:Drug/metabolite transporter (DMT)-like permease n=1 Tax=Streptosporangium becharense TaxID=1816182 RepID=A0A7W9IFY3_9ACTN|nr:DMT family transporter [Streptosporangium becharense]MBB2909034.1 drug/metabolite transporter (DMT)-like permease [Streptosporangium becharense]MBB5819948.1 drug/metabolite transporter (DMT)-like permease [Streptosporangium becharense]